MDAGTFSREMAERAIASERAKERQFEMELWQHQQRARLEKARLVASNDAFWIQFGRRQPEPEPAPPERKAIESTFVAEDPEREANIASADEYGALLRAVIAAEAKAMRRPWRDVTLNALTFLSAVALVGAIVWRLLL